MHHPNQLQTARLTLIAATLESVSIELEAPDRLDSWLNAQIPSTWPPGEYDRDALMFFRDRLETGGVEVAGWYGWYAVLKTDAPLILVGVGGYLGLPDGDGVVEIGYSILPEWQQRGYASELVQALVERAFGFDSVKKVIANTIASNLASIGVLLRCGFLPLGDGKKSDTLRFEHLRPLIDRKPL
jgi:[ribosomal protein S5]-alanine N-acetyltransferase